MPRTSLSKMVEEEKRKEEIIEEIPKKKQFDQNDGVLCRSVISGSLYFEGPKTQIMYSFSDYGDETEIEYRDLVAAVRMKDKAVFEPRFIVEDQDFIDESPMLEQFYSKKFTNRDIRAILDLPINQMIEKAKELPKGAFDALKSIAASQVSSGQLDSVKKIRALDELFGTDLNLLSDLLSDE